MASALGVRLVVVVGIQCFIDDALKARGLEPQYKNGYRITDSDALRAAVEAGGRARAKVEGFFSKVGRPE